MLTSVTTYYDRGKKQISSCYFVDENGMKRGIFLAYNKKGLLVGRRTYDNDLENGFFESYDDKGVLRMTGTMKDGLAHGLLKMYHPNGLIRKECWCQDGMLHGMCQTYYNDGSLKGEQVFKNGRSCSFKVYKRPVLDDVQKEAIENMQRLVRERRKTLDMITTIRKFLGRGAFQKEMVYQIVRAYRDVIGPLTAAEKVNIKKYE